MPKRTTPSMTHRAALLVAFCTGCLCCAITLGQDTRILVWSGNPAAPHLDIVGDDADQQPGPVRIVAARNGCFSGKVILCSAAPLKGISAVAGELRTADGKFSIPPSCVQVRFATGGLKSGWNVQSKAGSTFDVLSNEAPAEPVALMPPIARSDKYHGWVKTGRSYLPIWVTVAVPGTAAAGDYSGTLTVAAEGMKTAIAIAVKVHGYVLPDPKDFTTWIETIQSPDTLALEYQVPLWSDQHWKLIEQSLSYGAMLGNKTVYFPLICESNFGNDQSAVRWITDGPGRYQHDFGLVEKYLDLQTKVQGKPRIVCFAIWDNFLEGGQFSGDIRFESEASRRERLTYQGKGPEVTLLDPASSKTGRLMLSQYSDPASADLWRPLIKRIPEVLRKHGLEDSLFFGMGNDAAPHSSALDLVNGCIPGARWVIHAHSFYGGKDKKANFQYAAFVWGVKGFCNGQKGWQNPFLLTQFLRNMSDNWPITTYRMAPEVNITGGQRGLGRIGLDYWPVIRNSRGQRSIQVSQRYPKASWRNLNITDSLLAPGRDGPLATARFEMLREGVQECEARIFIETALDSGRVPEALAAQLRNVLADRDLFLKRAAITAGGGRPWFADANPSEEAYLGYAAGWQGQSESLYRAAADVAVLKTK
jgi:hypothetical protein